MLFVGNNNTCPLEDTIHYLLECPLYANARMQLFMNITPYTVILN